MSCKIKRNWLLGGYSVEFALTQQVTSESMCFVLDALLRATRDSLFISRPSPEFKNLKGRDKADILISELPAPQGEELLTVGGRIATESRGDAFAWSPFRTSLLTHFVRFEGSSHIIHAVDESRSDNLPAWIPWWLVASAAPIQIEYARLGFEHFTSKFRVTQFGFMPVVSDTLLIDIANEILTLRLTSDRTRLKGWNPFESIESFKGIAVAFRAALGISLTDQFARELEVAAA